MRQVDEWIGKTDDDKPPPRVQLRIWARHDGRCHITGRKIMPGDAWDLDHKIALCNGGQNRESNYGPALRDAHKRKTADDVKVRAKLDRIAKRHAGIKAKPKGRALPGTRASGIRKRMSGNVERWS